MSLTISPNQNIIQVFEQNVVVEVSSGAAIAAGGSGFPVGPASGDLSGTYPSPQVSGLKGSALPALSSGFLNYTGTAWAFSNPLTALANGSGTTASGSAVNLGGVLTTDPTISGAHFVNFSNFSSGAFSVAISPTTTLSTAGSSILSISPTLTLSSVANQTATVAFANGATFGANNATHAILQINPTIALGSKTGTILSGIYYNPTISGGGTNTHYAAVFGSGLVGIGTTTPGSTLHVVGSIRMVDGNQASGKVLTSDGSGIASWQVPASGFTNPMTTAGDMIEGGTGGVATRVGIGANGYVWTSNGTTAAWTAPAGTGITGLIGDVTATGSGTVTASVVKILGNTVPANASGYLNNNGSGTLSWSTPPASGPFTLNPQTSNYTFVLSDANTVLVQAQGTGSTTITVPPNSSVAYPIGTQLNAIWDGTGTPTFAAGSGVTLTAAAGAGIYSFPGQDTIIRLVKYATNSWYLLNAFPGTVTGASNGLTLSGGVIKLGGTLTAGTTIHQGSNNLIFGAIGDAGSIQFYQDMSGTGSINVKQVFSAFSGYGLSDQANNGLYLTGSGALMQIRAGSSAGTTGQYLGSDGSGNVTWSTPAGGGGGGTPAGSNLNVQYNNSGSFGAISNGTTGQVLTTVTTGSLPSWQVAPGSNLAELGVIINETWANLSAWTSHGTGGVFSATGGTLTINGGTGGSSVLTNYIEATGYGNSQYTSFTSKIRITIPATPGSTDWGFGLGFQPAGSSTYGVIGWIELSSGNLGYLRLTTNSGNSTSNYFQSNKTVALQGINSGDVLELTFTAEGGKFTITCEDLRVHIKQSLTCYSLGSSNGSISGTPGPFLQSTYRHGIYSLGGNFTATGYTVTCHNKVGADYLIVGDSFTHFRYLTPNDNYVRFIVDRVYDQIETVGGSGARITDAIPAEALALAPKAIIMQDGINDANGGVGAAGQITNLQTYMTAVGSGYVLGTNFWIVEITPNISSNAETYAIAYGAQWSTGIIKTCLPLDVYPGVLNPQMDSGDGVHPNSWGWETYANIWLRTVPFRMRATPNLMGAGASYKDTPPVQFYNLSSGNDIAGAGLLRMYNGDLWFGKSNGTQANLSSGSAAGSDTYVQYNSSGALGASPRFYYTSGTQTLTINDGSTSTLFMQPTQINTSNGTSTTSITPTAISSGAWSGHGTSLIGTDNSGNSSVVTLGTNLSITSGVLNAAGGTGWSTSGTSTITANTSQSGAFTNTATFTSYIHTQSAQTGTVPTAMTVTGGAHTALTASTEHNDLLLDFSASEQFATGALTTQRSVWIKPRTYTAVGASTFTSVYSLYVDKPVASTNVTITNNWAAGFNGNVQLGGNIVFSATGLNVSTVSSGTLGFGTTGSNIITIGSADNTSTTLITGSAVNVTQSNLSATNTFFKLTQGNHSSTGITALGFSYIGGTVTSISSSTENIDVNWNLARALTWNGTGTVATQRGFYIQGQILGATAASTTFTNAYTLYTAAPTAGTNGIITNAWAAGFSGNISVSATTATAAFAAATRSSTTTAITMTATDYTLRADTTSASIAVTLPTTGLIVGQIFIIKKINAANTLTVATVDGGTKTFTTNNTGCMTQWNGTTHDLIGTF